MRRLNPRDLERKVRHAITELEWWLERRYDPITKTNVTNAQTVTDRANADVDDALAGARYDSRGDAELTHPERHAERRLFGNGADLVAERMTRLAGTLSLIATSTSSARALADQLTTSHEQHDRQAQSAVASANPTAGRGHCRNCGRLCPGHVNDRIKSDRCSPGCYEYRVRHGVERPRELWPAEQRDAAASASPRRG